MQGTIEKGNISQAKERCKDCFALKLGRLPISSVQSGQIDWWCDEANCPIEDVTECKEWEVQDENTGEL